jgi:hypothetical protein
MRQNDVNLRQSFRFTLFHLNNQTDQLGRLISQLLKLFALGRDLVRLLRDLIIGLA